MKRARVVGAGVSGLAAALHLVDAGVDVEVLEAADGPGGLLQTRHTPHGLVERAANSFSWTPEVAHLFDRIGLAPEIASPLSRRRFIFRDGRPRRWPLGVAETASLLAHRAVATATRRTRPRIDETVAAWSDRVNGRAMTHWLIGPAMQGVYAAPADRLSASIVFGQPRTRSKIAAAPGGMGAFVVRLQRHLESRGVAFRFGHACRTLDPAIPTIVCTAFREASALILPYAPRLAAAMDRLKPSYLVSLTLFFEPHPRDVQGFGVLFPRHTGVAAYGVIFGADVFPSRSQLRSETWIYGSLERESLVLSADQFVAMARRDRQRLTGRDDEPSGAYFGRGAATTSTIGSAEASLAALPLYGESVTAIRERLTDLPGWLVLSGNYLGQLGISKLIGVSAGAAAALSAVG